MRARYLLLLVAFILPACGSTGGTSGPSCQSPQKLTIAGYSTGSTPINYGLPLAPSPYPTTATFLYFSAANGPSQTNPATFPTFAGTPILSGSDGTTITAGGLAPLEHTHLTIAGLYGYSSSISGLKPNVTYTVSFASLQWVQTGCRYGSQSAGSFLTS